MVKLFGVELGEDKGFYVEKLKKLGDARKSERNERALIGGIATLGIYLSFAVGLMVASDERFEIAKFLFAGTAGYFTFEALKNLGQLKGLLRKSGLEIDYENIINIFENRERNQKSRQLEGDKPKNSLILDEGLGR